MGKNPLGWFLPFGTPELEDGLIFENKNKVSTRRDFFKEEKENLIF